MEDTGMIATSGSGFVPKKAFFTKGVGVHRERLNSFEMALRDAGIAHLNLVRVSSILPPRCKIVPKEEGISELKPGQIVFCVMSDNATNEPGRLVSSAVGLARPRDPDQWGYISEHHSFGETEQQAGDYSEDLAATMLATVLGLEFDPDADYDERKEIYMMSGKIVESFSVVQSAKGHPDKLWTTVVAAVVFVI